MENKNNDTELYGKEDKSKTVKTVTQKGKVERKYKTQVVNSDNVIINKQVLVDNNESWKKAKRMMLGLSIFGCASFAGAVAASTVAIIYASNKTQSYSIYNIENSELKGFATGTTEQQIVNQLKQNNGVLKLPNVKIIADNAFENKLSNETIKSVLTEIKISTSTEVIGSNAFSGATAANITWSSENTPALKEIGQSAFAGCKYLTTFDFAKCTNLTKIGKRAFFQCEKFDNLVLTNKTSEIGQSAFAGCNTLSKIDLSSFSDLPTKWDKEIFKSINNKGVIKVKDKENAKMKYVEYHYWKTALENLGISRVTWTDAYSTEGDNKWELAVTHDTTETGVDPISNEDYVINPMLDKIDGTTLEENTDVFKPEGSTYTNAVYIPRKNITTISTKALIGTNVKKVLFQQGSEITTIGSYGLTSPTIETIDFTNATKLTTLADNALYDVTSLTSIKLPASIQDIGKNCFTGCEKLTSIDLTAYTAMPNWATTIQTYVTNSNIYGIFFDIASKGTINAASGLAEWWKSAFLANKGQGITIDIQSAYWTVV